jgi:hypothetical protein
MRKLFCSTICIAAVAMLATPALAQPPGYRGHAYGPPTGQQARTAGAFGAGVVGGTVSGLGVSEGWWGSTVAGVALPTTVAGAAAIGGLTGIGVVAAVDAFTQPCRGFAAAFGLNHGKCENGHYVGYAPRRPDRRRR